MNNLIFVLLLSIGTTGMAEDSHSESLSSAKKLLRSVDLTTQDLEHISIPFKIKNKLIGIASFEANGVGDYGTTSYILVSKSDANPLCRLGNEDQWIDIYGVGTVDLDSSGSEQIFIAGYSESMGPRILTLANPRNCKLISLRIDQPLRDPAGVPSISKSDDYEAPYFKKERAFLEAIKYDYGYFDPEKRENDPELRYYFWKKDNGNITDGTLKIRKYKGSFTKDGHAVDILKLGYWIYVAEFKGGVMAYNTKANEYSVLFFPQDYYHWPSILKDTGSYLLIGTHGEGLIVINLDTYNLKRFSFDPPDDDIDTLTVNGLDVLINNSRKFHLAAF